MKRINLDEAGINPDMCCLCSTEESLWKDMYGMPWCNEHSHRGKLINCGIMHQWPDLQCNPYAIGEGEYYWYIASITGIDELVWMALAAIEYYEQAAEQAS